MEASRKCLVIAAVLALVGLFLCVNGYKKSGSRAKKLSMTAFNFAWGAGR